VELEPLSQRLATGLARVAVAVHVSDGDASPAGGLERTLVQQQVMLVLSRRSDVYPLTDLAYELGMDRAELLAAVSTLVKEGLVDLVPAPSYTPSDVRVSLTEAGRNQPPELLNWAADLLAQLQHLNLDNQRRLLSVVTGHIRQMQKNGQIPVTRMCITCRFFDGYRYSGSAAPHHCWLVDSPFGDRQLRLRCPEAQPGGESPGRHRQPEY
jgi:DNA-binding MarR family transcriptional regulator